ncbi:hypothetical protein VCHA53O466_40438 [Vibrio chagasii]|nr:hypothetical protein VCHA53O466_40438 [Vibrio chagasii]
MYDAINHKEVKVTKFNYSGDEKLEVVKIFYPQANKYASALRNTQNGKIIGLRPSTPYHIDGKHLQGVIDAGGFVVGSELYYFTAWNCHDSVYRLGNPNTQPIETVML